MVILIIVCIIRISLSRVLKFNLDVEAFIFLLACFGNIIYHMFYCLAFFSNNWEKSVKKECRDFVHISSHVSLSENILNIFIAWFQTYFILGMHSSKKKMNHGHVSSNVVETTQSRARIVNTKLILLSHLTANRRIAAVTTVVGVLGRTPFTLYAVLCQ